MPAVVNPRRTLNVDQVGGSRARQRAHYATTEQFSVGSDTRRGLDRGQSLEKQQALTASPPMSTRLSGFLVRPTRGPRVLGDRVAIGVDAVGARPEHAPAVRRAIRRIALHVAGVCYGTGTRMFSKKSPALSGAVGSVSGRGITRPPLTRRCRYPAIPF